MYACHYSQQIGQAGGEWAQIATALNALGGRASWMWQRTPSMLAAGAAPYLNRLLTKRFYRGTTFYDAVETVENQAVNLKRLDLRQASAELDLGRGLYMTQSRETASIFAEAHGTFGRGGGPGLLEIEISRFRWWWFRLTKGTRENVPISNMEGRHQDFVPRSALQEFNKRARFSLDDL